MDPVYHSHMALKALDRDWPEEGDDEQSELDAKLIHDEMVWDRLREASQI